MKIGVTHNLSNNISNKMSNLPQIRRIYTNILIKAANSVKYDYNNRINMSYYRIKDMDEAKILNNLEKLISKLNVITIRHTQDDKQKNKY